MGKSVYEMVTERIIAHMDYMHIFSYFQNVNYICVLPVCRVAK